MNRAMLGRMVMRAVVGRQPPGTALIAVAHHLTGASVAVAAGADGVDLGAAPAEMIEAFRALHPGFLVCAIGPPADVVRESAVAAATGALLLCTDAEAAAGSGIPADRVLVDVPPAMVPAVSQAGFAALVDVDRAARLAAQGDPADTDGLAAVAGIAAIAAVSSWLGAWAVRTRHPLQVRRALDMTASIRGIRPPARAVRGLA